MLVAAPAVQAADPIMPLSEVKPGMRCTGLSVIKGTEISSFNVDIVDVIAAETGLPTDDPVRFGADRLWPVVRDAVEALPWV